MARPQGVKVFKETFIYPHSLFDRSCLPDINTSDVSEIRLPPNLTKTNVTGFLIGSELLSYAIDFHYCQTISYQYCEAFIRSGFCSARFVYISSSDVFISVLNTLIDQLSMVFFFFFFLPFGQFCLTGTTESCFFLFLSIRLL